MNQNQNVFSEHIFVKHFFFIISNQSLMCLINNTVVQCLKCHAAMVLTYSHTLTHIHYYYVFVQSLLQTCHVVSINFVKACTDKSCNDIYNISNFSYYSRSRCFTNETLWLWYYLHSSSSVKTSGVVSSMAKQHFFF